MNRVILCGFMAFIFAAWTFSPSVHAGRPFPADESNRTRATRATAGNSGKDAPFSFRNPENYNPAVPYTPPMFGDAVGFQSGFQGGFQSGFQGGFQQFQGGSQFQGGGFQFQGGFQLGGSQFQGGFQGGFQFGIAISPFRGAYKIAEGESPRPRDRAYVSYNYYHNVPGDADLHREIVGVEKAFFDGRASIGLRFPYLQVDNDSAGRDDAFGDLTVILKYAAINNAATGDVLTLGLSVTAPTGEMPHAFVVGRKRIDEVHSTLLQPFVGYIWNSGNFFVQGFTSILVPTDSDDATILFNDLGFGYRLLPSIGPFTAIVPTLEVHVNTPLNHRDSSDFPRFRDSVDLTAGFHFYFSEHVSLSVGAGTPVTSPRLFDLEALARFDFHF